MQNTDRADSDGRRVGRYVIYGELASGGMATVHLGRLVGPVGFSKTVAIKRLHPHLASEPDFVAMLIDEAKLVSSINHPNVVASLDVVYEDDELLLVMDYIEGETLARLLAPSRKDTSLRPPGKEIVARVIIDVLSGLHAAHSAKTLGGVPLHIVHRDVSPQNIMVGVDGIARVLDFGIAKAEHRRHSTRPGRIKGKFAYMSPEQIRGKRVDARTDVFATGVVLWECLAKRRLFRTDGNEQSPEGVLTMPVVPPSRYDETISRELDAVVLRALARDSAARFESAAEFAEALRATMNPASPVEVARWVTDAAKRAILDRSHLLHDLETSTINLARANTRDYSMRVPRPASQPPRIDRPNANAPTVVLDARAARETPRKLETKSFLALLGAGAGAMTLALVFAASTRSPADPVVPDVSARDGAREAEPAASPAATERTQVDARASSGASETASVPEPVRAEDLPRVPEARRAVQPAPVAAPTRLAEERATKRSPPEARARQRGVTTSRATAPLKSSQAETPKPPATASAPESKPSPETAAPARAPASCDPPYRIDQLGIRRIRRECL